MKKIIFVVAMLISALAVNAQDFFIKPMAGVNLANLTEDDCDMKTGFVIGLEAEKLVSQNVGYKYPNSCKHLHCSGFCY